jgi:hypothetical protein
VPAETGSVLPPASSTSSRASSSSSDAFPGREERPPTILLSPPSDDYDGGGDDGDDDDGKDESGSSNEDEDLLALRAGGGVDNDVLRLTAPIELLGGDRKFSSFQGAGQYRRAVVFAAPPPSSSRLETIPSPSRGSPGAKAGVAAGYLPPLRGMHGVTEMAEPEDLRAIFKAPRGAGGGTAAEHAGPNLVSPQSAHGRSPLRPPPPAGEGSEGGRLPPQQMQLHSPSLSAAYPVDDRQWSIPSIRLANHVESSSRHLYRGQSSGNFSEYTDEEGMSLDESYYSFLATDDDDDTASLSSRGSIQASSGERMRRFSRQFLRTMSSSATHEGSGEGGAADKGAAANAVFEPFQHPAPAFPAAAAKSNSFLERMRGISIEGASDRVADVGAAAAPPSPPPLPRRARTFDCESPPPILNIDVDMTEDDDAVDYYHDGENPDGVVPPSYSGGGGGGGGVVRTRESTSGRRRQRRRRHRKEGAAVEWIQDLQSRSNEVRQIAESASSKFLTGDTPTASAGANGLAPHTNSGLTPEAVARALGMPHPLCRSSTIEAGPLTLGIHRVGLYGRAGNVDVAPGVGGNNSIALTSSGSGD